MVQIRELSSTSSSGDLHPTEPMPLRTNSTGAGECQDLTGQGIDDLSQTNPVRAPVRVRGTPQVSLPPAKELFRRFLIHDKIGEGSYGKVWKCTERSTGEAFACKQVPKKHGLDSILQEIDCLAQVQGHQNILALEGVYESEIYLYIVTEHCNGGDLFEHLRGRGHMAEQEAKDMFRQIASAVDFCHRRGVIHRDIKPENILLHTNPTTGQITAKLADFGLARRLAAGERCRGWVGSEPYEAPEVIDHRPYGFLADVFSMGVVLFGMLAANWPQFINGREFNSQANFSFPGWRRVSPEAKETIASMLSLDPENRPTTAEILSSSWLNSEIPTTNGPDFSSAAEYRLEDALQAFKNLSLPESGVQSGCSTYDPPQSLPPPIKIERVPDEYWDGDETPVHTPCSTSTGSPRPSELSISWMGSRDSDVGHDANCV